LSKWLQDYLYIPLGGNRKATFSTYFLIVVIALIALILSGSIWVGVILLLITGVLIYVARNYPEKRKKINTNLNMMNTMLIGGIWHGASWNFMIWGGLNGIGILVYKFWKNWNLFTRMMILSALTYLCYLLYCAFQSPLFNIGVVWAGIILLGTIIRYSYSFFGGEKTYPRLETAWAIFQTFIFISFTRLFFRSGSNLDPVEANQTAWNTAKSMVDQIGGRWDFSQIGEMIYAYRSVFILIVIGMIIHWLPENFKRRYRLVFACLPLKIMAVIIVISIFIIYQFVTADLQKFIYFQF
jgi:D-alanyl-lipoteichoic acid acyltransferase DltB (MBOAT superfamily)